MPELLSASDESSEDERPEDRKRHTDKSKVSGHENDPDINQYSYLRVCSNITIHELKLASFRRDLSHFKKKATQTAGGVYGSDSAVIATIENMKRRSLQLLESRRTYFLMFESDNSSEEPVKVEVKDEKIQETELDLYKRLHLKHNTNSEAVNDITSSLVTMSHLMPTSGPAVASPLPPVVREQPDSYTLINKGLKSYVDEGANGIGATNTKRFNSEIDVSLYFRPRSI
jgi:hypothetical protein